MTDQTPLERIAARLPQALFDETRRAQGQAPYPLSATTLNRDEYAAMAARVMAAIGPLLAEEAAHLWSPDARPCCPHRLAGGPLRCEGDAGHDGAHVFAASSVPQINDTEARQA